MSMDHIDHQILDRQLALMDALACRECDEGYVENDRSIAGPTGHYTIAVREICSYCNGTLRRVCASCEDNFATHVDEFSDPVCDDARCNETVHS